MLPLTKERKNHSGNRNSVIYVKKNLVMTMAKIFVKFEIIAIIQVSTEAPKIQNTERNSYSLTQLIKS